MDEAFSRPPMSNGGSAARAEEPIFFSTCQRKLEVVIHMFMLQGVEADICSLWEECPATHNAAHAPSGRQEHSSSYAPPSQQPFAAATFGP